MDGYNPKKRHRFLVVWCSKFWLAAVLSGLLLNSSVPKVCSLALPNSAVTSHLFCLCRSVLFSPKLQKNMTHGLLNPSSPIIWTPCRVKNCGSCLKVIPILGGGVPLLGGSPHLVKWVISPVIYRISPGWEATYPSFFWGSFPTVPSASSDPVDCPSTRAFISAMTCAQGALAVTDTCNFRVCAIENDGCDKKNCIIYTLW
jgi:hypothetical protein